MHGRNWRITPFLIGFLIVAGSLAGCRKNAGKLNGDAAKQSLEGLKGQFSALRTKFSALRKQVEAIPQDLPGFNEVRAKFFAVEEGRGVMDVKVTLLASRLDEALNAGKPEELQQVSKEITETYDDVRRLDEAHLALMHQVMAFQRTAAGAAKEPVKGP